MKRKVYETVTSMLTFQGHSKSNVMVHQMKYKLDENGDSDFDIERSFEVKGHSIPNEMQAL